MVTLSIWLYPWHVRNHRTTCILREFYSCKSRMLDVINVGWDCSCPYCICCICSNQMWQVINVDLNCRIPSCTCYSLGTKYLPPCHAFGQESEMQGHELSGQYLYLMACVCMCVWIAWIHWCLGIHKTLLGEWRTQEIV